jgi:hypothetical protein
MTSSSSLNPGSSLAASGAEFDSRVHQLSFLCIFAGFDGLAGGVMYRDVEAGCIDPTLVRYKQVMSMYNAGC